MSWLGSLLVTIAGIVVAMWVMLDVGFRLGRSARARRGDDADRGHGAIEGAVFGLFGLLVAFTFTGSASRLDERRALVAEEANAISTSYLRLDLLGPELGAPIRPLYREYLELRIAESSKADTGPGQPGALREAEVLQGKIWTAVVAALDASGQPSLATPIMVPLNEMIDITTTRRMAAMMHPPALVFVSLGVVAMLASLLAGYATGLAGRRSLIHHAAFVLAIGGTLYGILEMEYPRLGLVTISGADVVLSDLRGMME